MRLPIVDLSGWPEEEREAEALRIATDDARQPFDLGHAPLLRPRIVRMKGDEHRLYLTLHHIIFDGVSIYRIFVPELIAAYARSRTSTVPPLPPPLLQYSDYAIWRERQTTSQTVTRQLGYWREQLAGAQPTIQLASDRPHSARPVHRGGMETFELPPKLIECLEALGRDQGATLYMVLLAVFGTLLHRTTGSSDIAIGGVTDTRRRPELTQVMGYFLNSIVLRTQPTGELRFRDYLTQMRRTVLGALDNSDIPFAHVVRAMQPRREPGRHPLFNVLFSIEPPAPALPELWDLTQMDVPVASAKFDLYLELDRRPDGMAGRFLFQHAPFRRPTIRRMIGHYVTLLRAVAADPGCTLARLPLLTPTEARQLLSEWNDTRQPIAQATLHGWFESQARRTPDALAVVSEYPAQTYRQLDERAEGLAARLRKAGVARGTLAAVCANRSPDMVAGLLAVLKAGGAYLPLDPDFPRARLQLILDDARPTALLTERRLLKTMPAFDGAIVLLEGEGEAGTEAPDQAEAEDLAYVLYTSGSTGLPKGVEVPHRAAVNLLASMQRNLEAL